MSWNGGILDHIDRPGSPAQGDFIDIHGQKWDVKGFQDKYPNGGFEPEEVTKKL